jgi:hypothetical protein
VEKALILLTTMDKPQDNYAGQQKSDKKESVLYDPLNKTPENVQTADSLLPGQGGREVELRG